MSTHCMTWDINKVNIRLHTNLQPWTQHWIPQTLWNRAGSFLLWAEAEPTREWRVNTQNYYIYYTWDLYWVFGFVKQQLYFICSHLWHFNSPISVLVKFGHELLHLFFECNMRRILQDHEIMQRHKIIWSLIMAYIKATVCMFCWSWNMLQSTS